MGRSLQSPVSRVAVSLLLLWLASATGTAAPFTNYQFRPLPGDDDFSRAPEQGGSHVPKFAYPGVGPSPHQPRYRFRTPRRGGNPRYSMPGYQSLPGPGEGNTPEPARNRPPAAVQPPPGYRFRPGGERGLKNRNR